jgi:AcrR family transcriptional regulator
MTQRRRSPTASQREMREPSRARRDRIVATAADVLRERGLEDTRIVDVARRAGMSAGHVMYYFESKDQLLLEAVRAAEDRFYAEVVEQLQHLASPRARLIRLIELWCPPGTARRSPAAWVLWPELWARALRDRELAAYREAADRRWIRFVADIVREGRRTGAFVATDEVRFAGQLSAYMDGLALRVMGGDAVVTAPVMREWCTAFAADRLGFRAPRSRGR